jgi:hypothetical protein
MVFFENGMRRVKMLRALGFLLLFARAAMTQADQFIFNDALTNSWESWKWATVSLTNSSPVHAGNTSIKVTPSAWEALYLAHPAQDASSFTNLTFYIHGGTSGGQLLLLRATLNGVGQTITNLPTLTTGWQQIVIPLTALGLSNQTTFDGLWIQDRTGTAQSAFYVDDISLTAVPPTPPVTNINVVLTVDAARNRHTISDFIYGVASANSNQLKDLNVILNRSGGNAETRYNWQLNAHNRGNDYYFQSIADSSTNAPGKAADDFVANSKAANAEAMITIPMIGWAPKLGVNRGKLASYSISKYGPQTGNDWEWFPDAGNGISTTNNTPITWNDPNDANGPVDSAFQQSFVQHLTNRWGTSIGGGIRYYLMDNEVSLWHSTHRDVHPVGVTMRELRDKFFDYAAKVKATDPNAMVIGPEEWGWGGFALSGYDQQWGEIHGWNNLPDRTTNGGWDYLPWFLDQVRQRATNTSQRLLDVFSVHYYPQGGEFSTNTSIALQLTRNRSTRSLWDTNYVDQSWINSVVQLIPRLKTWVTNYYPGTKTAITEYNWGAEEHINGATTQADILGIFGREGLDMANRWTTPASNTPTYKAMKLFRNYDGNKSAFGETSVFVNAPDPDQVSAFGALRSMTNALTLIVVNKHLTARASTTIALTNFVAQGTAQVWQLNASNVIAKLPDLSVTGASLAASLPSQSITLFVVPQAVSPRLRAGNTTTNGLSDFWVDGAVGQKCVVQTSSNLVSWAAVATNSFTSNSLHYVFPRSKPVPEFYRAVLVP